MAEQKHDSTQADKFRQTARELGCDGDEGRFEETVIWVAKAPNQLQGS